eukprot:4758456-Pyramimonas_sp.AAC.1
MDGARIRSYKRWMGFSENRVGNGWCSNRVRSDMDGAQSGFLLVWKELWSDPSRDGCRFKKTRIKMDGGLIDPIRDG